jgi:hypothetical protein
MLHDRWELHGGEFVLVPGDLYQRGDVRDEPVPADGLVLHAAWWVRGVLPVVVRGDERVDLRADVRAAESVRDQRRVLLADGDVRGRDAGGVRAAERELDAGRDVQSEPVHAAAAGGVLQRGAGDVHDQRAGAVHGDDVGVDQRGAVHDAGVSASGLGQLLRPGRDVLVHHPGELRGRERLDERGGVLAEPVPAADAGRVLHDADGCVQRAVPVPVHHGGDDVDGRDRRCGVVLSEPVPAAADGDLLRGADGDVHVRDPEPVRGGLAVERGRELHADEHVPAASAGNVLQSE